MATNLSNNPHVLLIVPAYNEGESILKVAETIRQAGYEFVVINDGSTDDTLQVCKLNDIPVINLGTNLGIGGAVQTGHLYALERGYDIDIQFDGDGQHDISSVPEIVAAVQNGANLVIGSRFISKDNTNFQSTGLRRLGIKWLSAVIKFVTGKRIYDVTSGFRACDRSTIELFSKE